MTENEIKLLDNFFKDYKIQIRETSNFNFNNRDIEKKLSYEYYEYLKNKFEDLPRARNRHQNDNRIFLEENSQKIKELENSISEINKLNLVKSGFFWYPPLSYCGWHTNSNDTGERIYYVFSQEENKSFFRYIKDGEMVTKYDNVGWTKNQFKVSNIEAQLNWHCVGSYTNRISIGFKVDNTKKSITLF
jgi:hypothetical protein